MRYSAYSFSPEDLTVVGLNVNCIPTFLRIIAYAANTCGSEIWIATNVGKGLHRSGTQDTTMEDPQALLTASAPVYEKTSPSLAAELRNVPMACPSLCGHEHATHAMIVHTVDTDEKDHYTVASGAAMPKVHRLTTANSWKGLEYIYMSPDAVNDAIYNIALPQQHVWEALYELTNTTPESLEQYLRSHTIGGDDKKGGGEQTQGNANVFNVPAPQGFSGFAGILGE